MRDFTAYQYTLILEALEKKRNAFIPGDKLYNDYNEIISYIEVKSMSASDWE
tara:strand:- start:669 stop:824 length:156 start_codon:yes stop_codon:yes gene_type:complete